MIESLDHRMEKFSMPKLTVAQEFDVGLQVRQKLTQQAIASFQETIHLRMREGDQAAKEAAKSPSRQVALQGQNGSALVNPPLKKGLTR